MAVENSLIDTKALAVDPSRKAFQDRLNVEFEGSLTKLRPLQEHLALTDHLIDQIVYRLYGLTDGEIQIVEGSY